MSLLSTVSNAADRSRSERREKFQGRSHDEYWRAYLEEPSQGSGMNGVTVGVGLYCLVYPLRTLFDIAPVIWLVSLAWFLCGAILTVVKQLTCRERLRVVIS